LFPKTLWPANEKFGFFLDEKIGPRAMSMGTIHHSMVYGVE
jgi:hypothetical protein